MQKEKAEKLYSDIPPTKLRNRKEKFRKAQNRPFWTWLADRVMFRMVSHRFYALRIKNLEAFKERRFFGQRAAVGDYAKSV